MPYIPTKQHMVSQHSLSINGKRQNITRSDLLHVAKKMNIKKADLIIDQVHAAVNKWNDFAAQTNIKNDLKEAISKHFCSYNKFQ